MKIRPIKIVFESMEDFQLRTARNLRQALQGRKKSIQSKDTMIWSSVEAYQAFMNDQKYAILAVIRKYQPSSIYQLAKILHRAQQNVARDCDLLAGHGFISFAESKKGRKSKAPQLAFDYNAIVVILPNVTYRVEFNRAA